MGTGFDSIGHSFLRTGLSQRSVQRGPTSDIGSLAKEDRLLSSCRLVLSCAALNTLLSVVTCETAVLPIHGTERPLLDELARLVANNGEDDALRKEDSDPWAPP